MLRPAGAKKKDDGGIVAALERQDGDLDDGGSPGTGPELARSETESAAEGAPASLSDAEDAALILRISQHRDKSAFAVLFQRYAGKIKAFMIRSGAAPELADEAAQEAMLALWRRAETFDPTRASAQAWIFVIARNKRVDLLRRGARPEPDPEDPTFAPDPEPPADAAFGAKRRDARVRETLAALSPEQRQVVLLSFYEGRAHSEIAEALDIPLGTVKSRLRLAFAKLRGALGAEFSDELTE